RRDPGKLAIVRDSWLAWRWSGWEATFFAFQSARHSTGADFPAPHSNKIRNDGPALAVGQMGEIRHFRPRPISFRRFDETGKMLGQPVFRHVAGHVQLRRQVAADEIDRMAGGAVLDEEAKPVPRLIRGAIARGGVAIAAIEGFDGQRNELIWPFV